jgi:hypothetical protein
MKLRAFLLVFAALAVSVWAMVFTPISHLPALGEFNNYVDLGSAAAEAMREGQFPIREAPRMAMETPPVFKRYPQFHFHAFLPSNLAGLLILAGLLPYHALLVVVLASFLAGFLGLVYWGRRQRVSFPAALAGGLVFTLAPYHLLAWSTIQAPVEVMAFGLIPWVLALGEDC